MTLKERQQERRELDDRMCEKINEVLDGLVQAGHHDKNAYPYAIGQITAFMEHAQRRPLQ